MAIPEIIMPGARFGRWTVSQGAPAVVGRRPGYFDCRCDCGAERAVYGSSLRLGSSTSCGCLNRERFHVEPGYKRCPVCLDVLPLSAFGGRPNHSGAAVRSKCKSCANKRRHAARAAMNPEQRQRAHEIARRWKRENQERNLATKMAWEARNPDKVIGYSRKTSTKWRAANKRLAIERSLASRAKNPEGFKAYNAKWAKEHPARCRARYKAYMAMKLRAVPKWSDEFDRFVIEEMYDKAQQFMRITDQDWHVDHQVPLQSKFVCGFHVHNNLRVIPGVENLSKGNRMWPDMWPRDP